MSPRDAPSAPSIWSRLARSLALWSLLWGLMVGVAVWLAAAHEVDELLDETLEASAVLLNGVLRVAAPPDVAAATALSSGGDSNYAWQLVSPQGAVLQRSHRAAERAWVPGGHQGFSEVDGWRVLGVPFDGSPGAVLYVGQRLVEREEALVEVTLSAMLAALAVALFGHFWLRVQVRRELAPIERLGGRITALDWHSGAPPVTLGAAEREELEPVVAAIDALTQRLVSRLSAEQTFVAHAAHALRTPLAGIDAQLAVLQQDLQGPAVARLVRVRGAAMRLHAVVAALTSLFKEDTAQARRAVRPAELLSRWAWPGLEVVVDPSLTVRADPDLLNAALLNLLDNGVKHGARRVQIDPLGANGLVLADDGPGIPDERRQALQVQLDATPGDGPSVVAPDAMASGLGLGLLLADRVARAHGGRLRLLPSARGCQVQLDLGPAVDNRGPAA
jgi:signal transduction histidine kinase